jgi:hypothetical protein
MMLAVLTNFKSLVLILETHSDGATKNMAAVWTGLEAGQPGAWHISARFQPAGFRLPATICSKVGDLIDFHEFFGLCSR